MLENEVFDKLGHFSCVKLLASCGKCVVQITTMMFLEKIKV